MAWPHFPPRKKFLSVQFKSCVTSNYTCAHWCRLLSFYIWTGLFRVSKPLNSWIIPRLRQHFGTKWPDHFSKDDYDPGQLLTHFQNSFTEYGGHFLAHHVLGSHKFACCGSLRYCRREVNDVACSGGNVRRTGICPTVDGTAGETERSRRRVSECVSGFVQRIVVMDALSREQLDVELIA